MTARRDFLVGIVFIGAVIAVGYMTVMIKGFSYFWTPGIEPLRITFSDVLGLEVGEEARARGVKVGEVAAVEYRTAGEVTVEVTLFKDPLLREDCSFEIRSKSPLGGKYLAIDPGTSEAPAEGTAFRGEESADLFLRLEELLREKKDAIGGAIDDVAAAARALRNEEGPLGALIFDAEAKEKLLRAVSDVAGAVTAGGEGEKGLLHAVLHDPELAGDVREAADALSASLARKDTVLGVVLHDPEAGARVREALAGVAKVVRDVSEGRGTVGRLFADEKLYDSAVAMADGLGQIARGDGVIPYLLKEPESREYGRELLVGLRDAVVSINEGDGTLAQLINKPDIHDGVAALLRQIRESVEDAREQAPINQLINMLGAVY